MRLIAVGDNVADTYLDDSVYYPGGQAVNVAVNARRDGARDSAYLGVFGDDDRAVAIRSCLDEEGVSCARCRTAYAPTAQPGVRLVNGDRTFLSGPRDSCQHLLSLRLAREDLELISTYDVCHTTNEAGIDADLARLHDVAPVSYDFSVNRDGKYLEDVCPCIDIAFFSGSDLLDDDVAALAQNARRLGVEVAVVTMGERGSMCACAEGTVFQDACETDLVDTMGAGDAFAAAFLVSYFDSRDIRASMAFAAKRAAKACTLHGAFGHPHRI